jgi:aminoglycoside phosphotransferase (APT) family kinase protein
VSAEARIDAPRPIRAGEELDLTRLAPWLRVTLGAAPDAPVAVEQFPGGHSNLTYLVRAGDREAVLRRPPFGSTVKSAHDMGREANILARLAPVWPKAPRPIAFCEDETVIGAKFYLMERIRGLVLRRETPAWLGDDEPAARRLGEALIDGLIELHAVDWKRAGLGEIGRPDGYVERQVGGWSKRYRDALTDDIAEMDEVAAWLAGHLPSSPAPTIVHNDYKLDNVVLDPAEPTRILGVLDWEMATIGDPLMDLGTALCYWVEADDPAELRELRSGPTDLPGSPRRGALAERYAAATGRPVDALVFYYVFGLFKTAVVLQQIYFRWVKGLTRDPRFATLGAGVRALARQARRTLDGRII